MSRLRGLVPLLALSAVVVLVTAGLAQRWWLPNLHNGLLALALATVGAYVLHQRPGHREGQLMVAAGLVEAVVFAGRQSSSSWWVWAGVWPVPLAVGLVTLAVLCFPDGRPPSPRWRAVLVLVVLVTGLGSVLSLLWPVGYDAAGVTTAHPLASSAPGLVEALWRTVVLPSLVACQVLWVVGLVVRWRSGAARRPLAWLLGAAAVSAVALVVGLAVAGSPRAGLLTAVLVPVAAGLAVVHAQHAAAYSALSWLSRSDADPAGLPTALARAAAEALAAPGATVWLGSAERLHPVGLWPPDAPDPAPTTVAALGGAVRPVVSGGTVTGALSVARTEGASRAEDRLLDDLARQAALVLDHLSLRAAIDAGRRAGRLDGLTTREREVLELIARGLSNAAICAELHLSVKTVEPVVSSIFAKLGLHADSASNRRVLAALEYERSSQGTGGGGQGIRAP